MKPPREQRALRIELLWLLPALVLGFLVYTNTLGGEFVYDDQRQIVRNTLIQDGSQFWRAMTSDVWAPGHDCPGIRIHAIDIVQPPGIAISSIADMDAHQAIVTTNTWQRRAYR